MLHSQSGLPFTCVTPSPPPPATCPGPDADFPDYTPASSDRIKTIRMAFHIMQQSANNPQNFEQNNSAHTAYLMEIFNRINDLYSANGPYACGGESFGWLPIFDTRIRFELVGIYYHPDPVGFINYDGTFFNSYCENTYGICNVLDVYFIQIPNGGSTGVATGIWIGMFNYFQEFSADGFSAWTAGNSLGHEIGHCLNVHHSWMCDQKCRFPDICQGGPVLTPCGPSEQNESACVGMAFDDGCFGSNKTFCQPYDAPFGNTTIPGESDCSTNFMSYARIKNHISPLQMSAMHKHLINNNSDFLKHEFDASASITIDQPNVVWNSGKVIFGNIYIEPGAKLTIKGKVLMPPGGRIVVKRGARLVVEGGHITTKGPTKVLCGNEEIFDRWQGIEVWGNTGVTATTAMLSESYALALTDPGVVILRQGAIIENAYIGIQTQQNGPYDWNTSKVFHFNGLISATNAHFLNCRKAVEFLAHLAPIDNPSIFTNCEFLENFMPSGQYAYEGVTQWQVKGIQYVGCTVNRLKLGIGILNSTMFVQTSSLTNCYQAASVSALSPLFAEKSVIGGALAGNRNTFENCVYSVVCNGYNFLQVAQNLFKNCTFGVTVEGSSGFQITDNIFQFTGAPARNFNAAISITSSGGNFNFAECNQYITVEYEHLYSPRINLGIAALGDNTNFTFRKEDFDCSRDVAVIKAFFANGTSAPGKISDQGTPSNAVHNLFKGVVPASGGFVWKEGHNPDIFTADVALGESSEFKYFYPPTAPVESRLVPKCPKAGFGIMPLCGKKYNFVNAIPFQNGSMFCENRIIEDMFNGGPSGYCRTPLCLGPYYTTIRRTDSLLNAGNAPQLLLALQSNPNSNATLQSLLAASPYLSDDVLFHVAADLNMTVANKGTVLNANTPLRSDLLENSAPYLPASLYNQLSMASATTTLSARTLAEAEKTEAERNKAGLLEYLCDSLFRVGNYAAVESLLQNDPDRQSREALVGLKIQLQNYTQAQTLLNNYPVNTTADLDFRDLQLINLRRMTDPNFQLTVAEDTFLHRQARFYGPQTGYARAMLYLLKGELFDRTISIDESAGRNEPHLKTPPAAEPSQPIFLLRPNPANDRVSLIYYGGLEGISALAEVFDLSGKKMLSIPVEGIITEIGISKLSAGLYWVRLSDANGEVSVQKLIKN